MYSCLLGGGTGQQSPLPQLPAQDRNSGRHENRLLVLLVLPIARQPQICLFCLQTKLLTQTSLATPQEKVSLLGFLLGDWILHPH